MEETVIKKKLSKDRIYISIIIFLIIILAYFIMNINQLKGDLQEVKRESYNKKNFSLIAPEIAEMSVEDFLEKQKTLTVSYRSLRTPVEKILNDNKEKGYFGVYFEDLITGAWMGINEKEREFIPASLLKLPILVATLKKVEKGEIKLEDTLKIKKEDIDARYGTLWKKGESEITIEELLNYLVKDSDNTALHTLTNQVLTTEEIIEAQYAMGLPTPEDSEIQKMSPRGYSNFLRSLYLSNYLRRTFSQRALTIMIDTNFNDGLPAGLPKEIKVAHKIGASKNGGYYHDCGIIYHPVKPYILCIMSYGSTKEDSDKVISDISKEVYEYVNNK